MENRNSQNGDISYDHLLLLQKPGKGFRKKVLAYQTDYPRCTLDS